MTGTSDVAGKAARLERLLERKLGARGRDLHQRVRRAGRRVPRRVCRDMVVVADAARMAGNPRLARQIDETQVERAYRRAAGWLEACDPADRRKGALLGALGALVVNLALAGALLVAMLRWRGFL